ncbi:MAG: glycosyl hydrolase, partial [Campylobacterales bacterium]|nr:glycosyl hydrolase [Campylobacterales bacterium]
MKEPFKWDDFSDQPAIIKDKSYKKTMRRRELKSLLKTFATSLVMLPISLVTIPFVKRKEVKSKDFFSLVVDFERESEESLKLIEELGVERVLLRFKLWEMQKLDKLKDFIDKLEGKKIILKVMQDRENIEDLELFRKNLKTIFQTLDDKVGIYEIGSTINRAKW